MSGDSREIAELPREDRAERDGVGEEDNPIPLWFNISFLATIVFAVVYAVYYLFSGWSQHSQYRVEVEQAAVHAERVRESMPKGNPYRGDAVAIVEGKQVFETICSACHKPDGSGLVGPSLIDPYWKYGSSDEELFETVTQGRPGGMPPWGAQLGSEKIWKALAYMQTLPRSDQPGLGAPVPSDAPGQGS